MKSGSRDLKLSETCKLCYFSHHRPYYRKNSLWASGGNISRGCRSNDGRRSTPQGRKRYVRLFSDVSFISLTFSFRNSNWKLPIFYPSMRKTKVSVNITSCELYLQRIITSCKSQQVHYVSSVQIHLPFTIHREITFIFTTVWRRNNWEKRKYKSQDRSALETEEDFKEKIED